MATKNWGRQRDAQIIVKSNGKESIVETKVLKKKKKKGESQEDKE